MLLMSYFNMIGLERTCMKNLSLQEYKVKNRFRITKRKLKIFKSQLTVTQKNFDVKVIQLQEEKSLLSRFLITLRKRPEIDLKHCLKNFEFSVVLQSLFTSDGEPIVCEDKLKILHHIEELGSLHEDQSDESTELNQYE